MQNASIQKSIVKQDNNRLYDYFIQYIYLFYLEFVLKTNICIWKHILNNIEPVSYTHLLCWWGITGSESVLSMLPVISHDNSSSRIGLSMFLHFSKLVKPFTCLRI